ncbi:MAG: BtrH N-terminal domain-containing protein [Anaerolineae bacterium]|nr:BtrH N-terminal domain-containing protein [Anaerolineae bacterium]
MRKLDGLHWHARYNEHMGCTKGCLDYLGIGVSFPWLYGGTGNAFVLNMNDSTFVDAAQAWDFSMLFDLAPNLGYTVERFLIEHKAALEMPKDAFLEKQREAFDWVRVRIDQGLPCYAWELTYIPAYYVITGYDDSGYTYSGWDSEQWGLCPWEKLGTFDVKQLAVNCIHPAPPSSDAKVVRDALTTVLNRVERPDGWAIAPQFRTGLPAYEMWAEALESGRAILDGEAYLNVVWREAREMAVEFLAEAKERLPGRRDSAFDDAIAHYTVVRDRLRSLSEMHPERPDKWDWQTTFASPDGAQLVREAAQAESQAVACLRRIVSSL